MEKSPQKVLFDETDLNYAPFLREDSIFRPRACDQILYMLRPCTSILTSVVFVLASAKLASFRRYKKYLSVLYLIVFSSSCLEDVARSF